MKKQEMINYLRDEYDYLTEQIGCARTEARYEYAKELEGKRCYLWKLMNDMGITGRK